jgi:ATP-dependent Clp protease ATP-binding subunit ClpA
MIHGRFTTDVRAVVRLAQEQARQLGQHWIGCEHLLFALASAQDPAGEVLRGQGVTPDQVRAQILRMAGRGHGEERDALEGIDRDALASIGIDLDAVRARVAETLGPDALISVPRGPRRPHLSRRQGRPTGHLRLTHRAKTCLRRSVRDARASSQDGFAGTGHLALALFTTRDRMAHHVLSALGVSMPQLRTQFLDIRPRAS